jgi:hypothetical protein
MCCGWTTPIVYGSTKWRETMKWRESQQTDPELRDLRKKRAPRRRRAVQSQSRGPETSSSDEPKRERREHPEHLSGGGTRSTVHIADLLQSGRAPRQVQTGLTRVRAADEVSGSASTAVGAGHNSGGQCGRAHSTRMVWPRECVMSEKDLPHGRAGSAKSPGATTSRKQRPLPSYLASAVRLVCSPRVEIDFMSEGS